MKQGREEGEEKTNPSTGVFGFMLDTFQGSLKIYLTVKITSHRAGEADEELCVCV